MLLTIWDTYVLENPEIIERICELCDTYSLDESKVSEEYLAFACKRKFGVPTAWNLLQFEFEVCKFIGEAEQSASSEEVMEIGMKPTENVESSPRQVAEKSSLPSVTQTKKTPKQKSIMQFFSKKSAASTSEFVETKNHLICEYCRFKAQKLCALKNHQNHCKAKPKSEVAKDFQLPINKGSIL